MSSTRRNNFIGIMLAGMLCLIAALALSGCESEPKTLEYYLADSPSAQEEIEESLSGLNNEDMDVTVDYDQNRIIITGKMKTTYKKKVLKSIKKSYKKYMKKNLTEPMEKAVGNIERETKIDGVSIQVIINNGDGAEIWSQTYPLAEEPAETDESSGKDDISGSDGGSDKEETKAKDGGDEN